MGVSMRHFFENTREMVRGKRPDPVLERFDDGITTISYPEQKRPYPERFRGVHRLTTRDDGSMRCVACLCCSTACPAQCIYIEAGEYPEGRQAPRLRALPGEVRHRRAALHLLRLLRRGVPLRRHPHGHRHARRARTTRATSSSTTGTCSCPSRAATATSRRRTRGTSRATRPTRASPASTRTERTGCG